MARNTVALTSVAGVAAALVLVFALFSASSLFPGGNTGNIMQVSQSKTSTGGSVVPVNSTLGNSTTSFPTFAIASSQALKKFASIDELQSYITASLANSQRVSGAGLYQGFLPHAGGAPMAAMPYGAATQSGGVYAPSAPAPQGLNAQDKAAGSPTASGAVSLQHSSTNVQVAGVDEPDFLKNDAKYAYILSGDKLTIIDAYPPNNASITIKFGLDIPQGQTLQNMFLSGDRLVVFYQDYSQDYVIPQYDYIPQPVSNPRTHIVLIDISDRENPKILHDYKVSGAYSDARMIGDYAYVITSSNIDDYYHPAVPRVMESSKVIAMPDVYYFDNPEQSFSFTTVTSLKISAGNVQSKTFLMDPASTVYASETNLYITYQKYMPYNFYQSNSKDRFFKAVVPLLPSGVQSQIQSVSQDSSLSSADKWDKISTILQNYYNTLSESDKSNLYEKIQQSLADYDAKLQQDLQKTVIHKIALGANGTLNYVARGEVQGRLLNQFSMDENGTNFRVATTSEYYSQYRTFQSSNVFVLDDKLNTVGSLEQIAPNESIYSARFIGDRLYLVTFRQVDPLFVIDLSSSQPKVLGSLKLPGFSTYLHPFDATHIIGIGRNTQDNGYGGVEPLGVQLALFDVSDVSHPVKVGGAVIGGQGTDSEALYDHKAFFFDSQKGILSIPVTFTQYGPPVPLEGGAAPAASGAPSSQGSAASTIMPIRPPSNFWRGFYVFGVDASGGFTLKAKIAHFSSDVESGLYPYYGGQGGRTFYIGNVLYTVSANMVMKMNSLDDPSHELNTIDFGNGGGIVKYGQPPTAEAGNGTVHSSAPAPG